MSVAQVGVQGRPRSSAEATHSVAGAALLSLLAVSELAHEAVGAVTHGGDVTERRILDAAAVAIRTSMRRRMARASRSNAAVRLIWAAAATGSARVIPSPPRPAVGPEQAPRRGSPAAAHRPAARSIALRRRRPCGVRQHAALPRSRSREHSRTGSV